MATLVWDSLAEVGAQNLAAPLNKLKLIGKTTQNFLRHLYWIMAEQGDTNTRTRQTHTHTPPFTLTNTDASLDYEYIMLARYLHKDALNFTWTSSPPCLTIITTRVSTVIGEQSCYSNLPRAHTVILGRWTTRKISPPPLVTRQARSYRVNWATQTLLFSKPLDLAQMCHGNKICSKPALTWKLTLVLAFPAHCISN